MQVYGGATSGDWSTLLSNVTEIRLSVEALSGSDIQGVDNFTLETGTASTVPVPSSAWLFGSGLLGLVSISRRKKA